MPDTQRDERSLFSRTRADSVRFAIANNAIEGMFTDARTEAVLNAWANGLLTNADLIAMAESGKIPCLPKKTGNFPSSSSSA
jgi:hypothetical protein